MIDAHAHIWDAHDGYHDWLGGPGLESLNRADVTTAELVANAERARVDGVVLVEGGADRHPFDTELLLRAAEVGDLIVGAVIAVDLLDRELDRRLDETFDRAGAGIIRGARTQVQGEAADYLSRSDVREAIAVIGARGLSFDLVVTAPQRGTVAALAASMPDVVFVLDHLGHPEFEADGRPTRDWSADLAAIEACPNVFVKFSGLRQDYRGGTVSLDGVRELAETAIDVIGPQRLLWGSDWPMSLLHDDYSETAALARTLVSGLSASEQDEILEGTARRAYRLP